MKRKYISFENWNKAKRLQTYNPKFKKWVLSLGLFGVVVCLITPATNWIIPFIIKGVWRYG